jgi:hypothetical protein
VLVTSTQFANWFMLRNHPDAQPEIQDLAKRMLDAYNTNKPELLQEGDWHLPYITIEDYDEARDYLKKGRITRDEPIEKEIIKVLCKISTARCARISYKPFDGTAGSIEKDIELHDKLVVSQPVHASPAEHQATPDSIINIGVTNDNEPLDDWRHPHLHGNLGGWIQYRKTLQNEFLPG